jgi:hypothetical protein
MSKIIVDGDGRTFNRGVWQVTMRRLPSVEYLGAVRIEQSEIQIAGLCGDNPAADIAAILTKRGTK